MTLNLETNNYINPIHIFIDGNASITKEHKKILEKYEVIIFGKEFNQKIENIPPSIKAIIFAGNDMNNNSEFNQPITNLGENIEYLYLHSSFDQELDNLPRQLKYLIIKSYELSTPINYLPETLEYLVIKNKQFIIHSLPSNLKELYIDGIMNYEIGMPKLPNELKTLYLRSNNGYFNRDNTLEFPDTLEKLIIFDYPWNSTNSTKLINVMKDYLENKKLSKTLKILILPQYMCQVYPELKELAKYIENITFKFVGNELTIVAEHILTKYTKLKYLIT